MGKYNLDQLWSLWQQEQITAEMAVGHLLQNLIELRVTVLALQQTVAHLQKEMQKGDVSVGKASGSKTA